MSLYIIKYTSHLVLSLFYLSQEVETVLYLLPEYLITIFYFEVSVVLIFFFFPFAVFTLQSMANTAAVRHLCLTTGAVAV